VFGSSMSWPEGMYWQYGRLTILELYRVERLRGGWTETGKCFTMYNNEIETDGEEAWIKETDDGLWAIVQNAEKIRVVSPGYEPLRIDFMHKATLLIYHPKIKE